MTPKQKVFIESVVALDNGNNRPVLEAALKLYIMNEGVIDFWNYLADRRAAKRDKIFDDAERFGKASADVADRIGTEARKVASHIGDAASSVSRRLGRRLDSAVGHVNRALTSDPAKMDRIPDEKYDVSAAEKAVDSERLLHTWEPAYRRFLQACDFIGYFLKTYGGAEIIGTINSADFKQSLAIGDEIDRLRPSPMFRDTDKVKTYIDMVESISTPETAHTVDTIVSLFEASEKETSCLPAMVESSAGNSIMVLKNELAVVRNFNAAHGSTPWRKWTSLHRAEFAMGSRNNWATRNEPAGRDDDDDE